MGPGGYRIETTSPLDYLDNKKLYELTAKLTDSTPREVEEVVDYCFKHAKDWINHPWGKGGYFIKNFGTFSFNPGVLRHEVRKRHERIRKSEDPDRIKTLYEERDRLKLRHSLGINYEAAKKAKGTALNAFRHKDK